MKTTIIIFLLSFSISLAVADAQYRINKKKYDYHGYSYQPGDPYNPGAAAFGSLIAPGLGQMISGETGRGLFTMGRCAAFLGISVTGFAMMLNVDERDPDFNKKLNTGWTLIMTGLGCAAVNWLWAIIDAPKVAKVNNLAYRDLGNKPDNLSFRPYFGLPVLPENRQLTTGVSLSITF